MEIDLSNTIEIRILADGQVYIHGTSEDLFEIATLLCPKDPWVVSRACVLNNMRQNRESKQEGGIEDVTQEPGK